MSLDPALIKKIEDFVATRSVSDGDGRAPVAEGEAAELRDIFEAILEAKYESDLDGDLPINVSVLDRTKYEAMLFGAIPYLYKIKDRMKSRDVVKHAMRMATMNLNIAHTQLEQVINHMEFGGWFDEDEKTD